MLEHIADVEWSRLHHAYGPALDVPDLLRALVEPEKASAALLGAAATAGRTVPDQVEWVLWGNVFHQGSRWQVTASVVPYLVEILRDGPAIDRLRRFLVSYLHHLAMGYPEDSFPERFDPDAAFRDLEGVSDPGGEPDYQSELLAGVWERDSYLAVERGIDTIAPLMAARDEETALETIALAASFPRRAVTTVPLLQAVARGTMDRRAAHAAVSLAQLVKADGLADAERLVGAAERSVATMAACAAVLAAPGEASARAIELLSSPLGEIAGEVSVHAGSLTQLVGRCLVLLPEAHRDRAIDAIARQHRNARPDERVSLTASMLSLAFKGQRAPALARDLTPSQRRAVETIRDHGAFTIGGAQFVNYGSLVRGAGLPNSSVTLDKWLRGDEQVAPAKSKGSWWKLWKRR